MLLTIASVGYAQNATVKNVSVRNEIIQGLLDYKQEISLAQYNVTVAQVQQIRQGVTVFTEPRLWHVRGADVSRSKELAFTIKKSYKVINGRQREVVTSIIPHYKVSERQYRTTAIKYEHNISRILAEMPRGLSDRDKILYVHQWLVKNVSYQKKAPNRYNAVGAIVDGQAVCKGYALAVKDIMNRLGIPAWYVVGNNNRHAWNIVKADGQWYHVDATWDAQRHDKTGIVSHRYVLLSSKAITAAKHKPEYIFIVKEWQLPIPPADSEKYDRAWWRSYQGEIRLPAILDRNIATPEALTTTDYTPIEEDLELE